jgi:hypothetical protein
MKSVIGFLKRNGFKRMEKNSYANNLCNVVITENSYEVANNDGITIFSHNLHIYWLIGVLTSLKYIPKDYVD